MTTLDDLDPGQRQAVEDCRRRVADLHALLPRYGLVVWTAGNVSERVPGTDLMVIKPSGVEYDEIAPDVMVVCDFSGRPVTDPARPALAPSSDTAAHAYVYRHLPSVGGVVHTHSTYATAWSIAGEDIPCCMTMMGDEFGGPVPVGPFAVIGDESIGQGLVETLRATSSPAVLMRQHGPFTVGADGRAAVKAAVMVEEVARTAYVARGLAPLVALPDDVVASLHDRYQHVYGQR